MIHITYNIIYIFYACMLQYVYHMSSKLEEFGELIPLEASKDQAFKPLKSC